ncbi:MAG: flagellar assembly protein FliW [Oscillospiraceae bacterium]|nr:flagellar assembly protein FliW [Oscillospiraceae bacterium]
MTIITRDFGEVEIAQEEILTFPAGLFAFEDLRQFVLLSPLGEDVFPKWLQSTTGSAPCFIVFDPNVVCADYAVILENADERLLRAHSPDTLSILVLATVPEDFTKTTLNLRAPIVINTENNLAAQVILADYEFKHPLYKDEAQSDKADMAESAGEEPC